MKKFILLLTTLFPSFVFSQVPHTFQSGDPVSSSKINENFAFVGKRLYLKSDGQIIGTILSISYNCRYDYNCPPYLYDTFVTDKGYFYFGLWNTFNQPGLVEESPVYYSSSDCTGTAYAISARTGVNVIYKAGSKYYYSNAGDTPATYGNMNSVFFEGRCGSGDTTSKPKYTLKENDESITGFPNTIGTLTISYE